MMNLGLRAKSALALGFWVLVVLGLATLAGWRALLEVENNLGSAFARNVTQFNKQRILAPVARELALSQRLADSVVTRQYLLDESDAAKKALFFAEAERYRGAFDDKSYFLISRATRNYYFNDAHTPYSDRARYALQGNDPTDAWFFSTMKNTREFNINVDPDVKLKVTKVWFNVMVKDGKRNLGLAGTGLELTSFLKRFITSGEAGVTPMILNRDGHIQAHPDQKLIDYASVNDKGTRHSTIYDLMPAADHAKMRGALEKARQNSDAIPEFWGKMGEKRQLFAVSFLPELNWFVVTGVDLGAAQVVDQKLWLPLLIGGAALLLMLMGAILWAVNRILLVPLLKLTHSVRAVGAGNYDAPLPPAGRDELGELTRAFGAMAAQVKGHTNELEGKVSERTRELVAAGEQMALVNKQIGDSIQYASLIQGAILPRRELERELDGQNFVMWHPRDVVGGDFYVFRSGKNGALVGVVDCAGHGVAGAFMTMIAYAVLNVAIDTLGMENPARLLAEMDARLRALLQNDATQNGAAATNMDVGLCYLDYDAQNAVFAGAKVSLYFCDGENVGEIKGDKTAVGGKRIPSFSNRDTPLRAGTTFYLTTDGLLDQAGGPKGYSFGGARFNELLLRQYGRPLTEQRAAFEAELRKYQGDLPQRDDITLIGFHFAPDAPNDAENLENSASQAILSGS